jgi:DNA repair protein RecO (recombination protein O)
VSPQKTNAIILRIIPYRETSAILYLFTSEFGLVHGIAKGIFKADKRRTIVERGFCIEVIIYMRPQKELFTLGSLAILDFFPATRENLIKAAIRDVIFETVAAAITVSDPHPELYDFLNGMLLQIEAAQTDRTTLILLWQFFVDFAGIMGFGIDMNRCCACGGTASGDIFLDVVEGRTHCDSCNVKSTGKIPSAVRTVLTIKEAGKDDVYKIESRESRRITRLLSDYCRHHFDINREFKTLTFFDEMLF